LTRNKVAQELGIELRAYDAYEAGTEHPPAFLLTKFAELFDVPVFWFFQDIAFMEEEIRPVASRPRAVYRVATLEERMHFLADTFRKLNLEEQQHLLAFADALVRTSRKDGRD
jgi:transcriptional regulator with XRE-family HTH domain